MDKRISKEIKVFIKVPGTSANLGPGFDIFGIALDIYNEFYFELGDEKNYKLSLMKGEPLPFIVETNLIQEAYFHYYKKFLPNVPPLPFDVEMNLSLPIKGGLGSSASALVAGFCLGRFVHELFYSEINYPSLEKFLYELAFLEGHPDNTTPAYLGGFVFSYIEVDKLVYFSYEFPNTIDMYLFIPALETETNHSRKKLPQYYSIEDVVFNLSRVTTWMQFLKSGNFEELRLAVQDRVHTPYRIRQLPFLEQVSEELIKLGACFTLSGSGPSLLIFLPRNSNPNFKEELRGKILDSKIQYRIQEVNISSDGTIVKNLTE